MQSISRFIHRNRSESIEAQGESHILLIDGDCPLCRSLTRFVAKRDKKERFRFAALQSELALDLLQARGIERVEGTFILVEQNRIYMKSEAALRVVRHLDGLWPLLAAGQVLPLWLRNWAYDAIAARRYRWKGKHERQELGCSLHLSPEVRKRLLFREHERGVPSETETESPSY